MESKYVRGRLFSLTENNWSRPCGTVQRRDSRASVASFPSWLIPLRLRKVSA